MDYDNMLEQLAHGGLSNEQQQQWSQAVGSALPDQFYHASSQAVSQLDPQEYEQHFNSQPLSKLTAAQRVDLARMLLAELFAHGVERQTLSQATGVRNFDPTRMSSQDLAAILKWTQQNHPDELGLVAAQFQDQPDVLQSILSNNALLAVVAALGAGLLTGQISRRH